jgi:group I intron endonuclease
MKGFIYKITNKENGKFYIGSTIDIVKRKRAHFRQLKKGEHHCFHLQKAYEKYGKENFELTYKEIEVANEAGLRLLEERYINYCWNSGKLYNVSKKGCGGDLISYHPKNKEFRELQSKISKERYANLSDEEKIVLSERMKGEKNPNYGHRWSKELREKVSKHLKDYYLTHESYIKGKTFEEVFGEEKSKELRQKISENASKRVGNKNPFFGKHHSEETKKKLSKLKFGKKNLTISKKVLVNGVVYQSVDECAAKLNINYSTVAYRCRKHIYGFSYIGENDNLPQRETKKMWTFEECEKLASECKTIKELEKKYPKVLHYLRNHKDKFEIIKNKYFTYIRTYWTFDKVMELAKKYDSYKEFRENEPTAYSSVIRHKWVNKIKSFYGYKEIE